MGNTTSFIGSRYTVTASRRIQSVCVTSLYTTSSTHHVVLQHRHRPQRGRTRKASRHEQRQRPRSRRPRLSPIARSHPWWHSIRPIPARFPGLPPKVCQPGSARPDGFRRYHLCPVLLQHRRPRHRHPKRHCRSCSRVRWSRPAPCWHVRCHRLYLVRCLLVLLCRHLLAQLWHSRRLLWGCREPARRCPRLLPPFMVHRHLHLPHRLAPLLGLARQRLLLPHDHLHPPRGGRVHRHQQCDRGGWGVRYHHCLLRLLHRPRRSPDPRHELLRAANRPSLPQVMRLSLPFTGLLSPKSFPLNVVRWLVRVIPCPRFTVI